MPGLHVWYYIDSCCTCTSLTWRDVYPAYIVPNSSSGVVPFPQPRRETWWRNMLQPCSAKGKKILLVSWSIGFYQQGIHFCLASSLDEKSWKIIVHISRTTSKLLTLERSKPSSPMAFVRNICQGVRTFHANWSWLLLSDPSFSATSPSLPLNVTVRHPRLVILQLSLDFPRRQRRLKSSREIHWKSGNPQNIVIFQESPI